MESYKIIIICIPILVFLVPIAVMFLEMGMSNRIEKIEQIKEEDIKRFNESANRLIESTSCTADEYEKAIKALREPITFIEPTPSQEKLMEAIINKPLLSVNEIRESMNMSPLKAESASLWEKVEIEPKGHLLALKCETCGGELKIIRSIFADGTFGNIEFCECKYCGNKYIFKGD